MDVNNADPCSYADVDLQTLIQDIYIAPLMDDELATNVYEVSKKFSIDSKIKKSDLYTPPVY